MDKITIATNDRSMSITLPRVRDVKVGAEEVCNTVKMASGKLVKDMIGHRPIITASWDYVPAAMLQQLAVMLRRDGFFFVQYPSPEGDAAGTFEIEYPEMSVFRYKDGIAVWHDVTLKMTSREVIR